MTKLFYFSKTIIQTAFVLMMSLMLVLSVYPISTISAFAAQANTITEDEQEIKVDRVDPIYIKFPYGSVFNDQAIQNSSARIEISGKGFEIDKSQIIDQYYTDNIEQDGQTYPRRYQCQGEFAGKKFIIDSSLVTASGIPQYGFQTATNADKPSGDVKNTLQARHTGCLILTLKVSATAQDGDLAKITFNQNVLNSQDYGERTKPGLQIVQLKIASTRSCSDSEEFVLGSCKKICDSSSIRNIDNGRCEGVMLKCSDGAEIFNNQCVKKCITGQERDLSGRCIIPDGYVCQNDVCTQSNPCVNGGCENKPSQIELGETETRILIMLIITSAITVLVLIAIFVFRKIQVFQKINAPRKPRNLETPDNF